MSETWHDTLALTHCGDCGEPEAPLYWTGEGSPTDRQQWQCFTCLKRRQATDAPRVEAQSDEPRFVLEADRPEVIP